MQYSLASTKTKLKLLEKKMNEEKKIKKTIGPLLCHAN
jgi:hypothetical protein